MKKWTIKIIATLIPVYFLFAVSCGSEPVPEGDPVREVIEASIIPSSTSGRTNLKKGCVEISDPSSTIEAWNYKGGGNYQFSLFTSDGKVLFDNVQLGGEFNKNSVAHSFPADGFDYLILYAEEINQGDTSLIASISISGEEFVMSSTLNYNGAVDVVIPKNNVACVSNPPNDTIVNNGSSGIGNAIFWTSFIPDSGPFNITLDGYGSKTVSGFFNFTPDCSDGSQGGLFENIPVGTYSYTVTDYPAFNGTGSITIIEGQCSQVDFTL